MSLGSLLFVIFIQPLYSVYDVFFVYINDAVQSPGLAIVAFAIDINLILLPLYYQMELAGSHQRKSHKKMMADIARMRKHYQGRERFFYIRAIHNMHGHKPWTPFLSAFELYVQVFFFVTVYYYLDNNEMIQNASFLFIKNLSEPDGALFGINLLPIIMTLANIASVVFYTDDANKRNQSYLLAALFLVLLYNSPAGLVLYWTCNNIFSFFKNCIQNYFEKSRATKKMQPATGVAPL